ncbi:hypothetical protein CI109_105770 [Kwoniella shandongensis]|uniref:Uncharacterized protein n=1 Tax=Kwoniella shandongensis TaxID=1734106 RepID=A0A5M6C0B9_9TREE|nr:uncharacterized protein CI109_003109 [Kwoniella shandongensis]KAA5528577.1 hypothetical protein CI109_003109 [Kwoniella shandongensis]
MVQAAGPSGTLDADDYLCPLTTIRDTLLRPETAAVDSSIPKLQSLLSWHKRRIEAPWQPFKSPSAESRAMLNKPSFTIPNTSVQFDVDESTRRVALKVSDVLGLDEIAAFMMAKSYLTFSVDEETDEEKMVERVILWYSEETLAVPQIALALLKLSDDEGPLGQAAHEIRMEVMADPAKYIEGLFRAFSGLAQRDLDEKQRSSSPLFWAKHQLRTQEILLNLLFVMLYQTPSRPASISEGLIKGAIMSAFGTSQANRDIWENDGEAQRLAIRIRDLMVIIALESLCLGQVVSPVDPINEYDSTLLQTKEKIQSVHEFLVDYSNDLSPRYPEPAPGSLPLPIWPMAIICLSWAIILRSIPEDKVPSGGDGTVNWQDMTIRALRLPSGLFPWLEEILSGSLLQSAHGDVAGGTADVELYHRKILKDVLIGLSELVQLENIADRPGLYRSWELLFGGGSPSTVSVIDADFWIADFPYEERRSVLDRSQFPHEPVHLLRVLSSLGGSDSSDASSSEIFGTDPVAQVHHYFSNLPSVTHTVEPGWCRYIGKDEQGKEVVEAVCTLVLPGGASVPRGSKGFIVKTDGSTSQVMWTNQIVSGWTLLLEILQAAAGIRAADERTPKSAAYPPDSVYLSVRDLDMQLDTAEILAAGIKYLRSVLHSSPYIKATILTDLSPDNHLSSGQTLLHLALTVLNHSRLPELAMDPTVVSDAVDIVQALITAPSSNIWPGLRSSGFFDPSGKRRGSVAALIQADSVRGEHALTTAVLRLVLTLVNNAHHVPESDSIILKSALHLVFADIWNNFSAWRYKDVARKYELSSLVVDIFDTVLRHPLTPDGSSPATTAQVLIDLFITATSPLTYRPLVEAITQSGSLIPRLIGSRRHGDAELVVKCLDESVSFLGTLFRVSSLVGCSANTLPKSLLVIPISVSTGDKIQFIDNLFDVAFAPAAQTSNILNIFKTLRVYLEVIGTDQHRPSLASMLRSPTRTFESLTEVAVKTDDLDVKAEAWHLLATIVATQPGCVQACVGSTTETEIQGTLKSAIGEIATWELVFRDAPHVLAAALNYVQSVMRVAGADKAIAILRKDNSFWQSVFDLSIQIVPAAPSFSLSIHADDFQGRIQRYAYAVQAKANAASLLAAELTYAMENDDEAQPETKARQLVLSLFRNNSALQEAVLMATHTSCLPELHEEQGKKVKASGGTLQALRTISLPAEREYGRTYLYDGNVTVQESISQQASVNLAMDMLNLNWSMLDADIALTRSFRVLAESVAGWTEGDGLAMSAALRAGVAIAETIAEEYREGDVMLAIQVERLSILAVVLETALDTEDHTPNAELVQQLAISISTIIASRTFPPILSLRHPELPAIHQPVLRILYLLLQVFSITEPASSNIVVRESLIDAGTSFAFESADIVLESVSRGEKPAFAGDLSMVVGVLCEISKLTTMTTAWMEKVQGVSLITRSLDVLVRARVEKDQAPLHLSSILLLHLALASNPSSAEKVAISGILPAYSDNAIVVEAEHGRIDSPASTGHTVHDAWCGMLLVIKALLSTLPDTATFTRTDVIPFIRVSNAQMLRAMSWGGESPLTAPGVMELELVVDVFYGVACALGPGSLADYSTPALQLLKGIRYAFSHPRLLSTLFVPSSEEERATLEGELELIEGEKEVDLLDPQRTPILAERVTALLRIARTVILTLTVLTRSWDVVREDVDPDRAKDYILESDHTSSDSSSGSTSSDPVGVINDIYILVSNMVERLATETDELSIRGVTAQLLETAGLLSLSQLQLRQTLLPQDERDSQEDDSGMSMDIDAVSGASAAAKRRMSMTTGQGSGGGEGGTNGSREGMILRELQGDLIGILTPDGGMLGVLRKLAEKSFGDV